MGNGAARTEVEQPPASGAAEHQAGGGELALERVALGERARRVVARPVDDPHAAVVLHLDAERVVLAVGGQALGLEGEDVGDARPLEQASHRRPEVVGVVEELAAGLVGHHEQAVLAAGVLDALVAAGGEAADVDALDRAVGAAELLEHAGQVARGLGVAEAVLGVDQPVLAGGRRRVDVLRLLVVGRALDERAVEALGQVDDVLPPLDAPHQVRQVGERAGHRGDVVLLRLPRGAGLGLRHLLEGVEEGLLLVVAPLGALVQAAALPLRRDQQPERVGVAVGELGEAEGIDGVLDLPPVGGEADDELRAAGLAVGRHRHQVGALDTLFDHLVRRRAALDDRRGLGVREVEEEEEVAAGGDRHRALLPLLAGGGRLRQVDDVEAGDLLLLLAVVELEVGGGQAAHRLVALDDGHRHLDGDDRGGLVEPLAGGPGGDAGAEGEGGDRQGDEDLSSAGSPELPELPEFPEFPAFPELPGHGRHGRTS